MMTTFLVAEDGSERSRNDGRVVSSGSICPSMEHLASSVAAGSCPMEPRHMYNPDHRRESVSEAMSAPLSTR
jgi:hypothetical protein